MCVFITVKCFERSVNSFIKESLKGHVSEALGRRPWRKWPVTWALKDEGCSSWERDLSENFS